MRRPKLLDLFCCAGGAAMGYSRAGFDVVGVDIRKKRSYPFEFIQADALEFSFVGFDAIHASPPCQHFSPITTIHGRREEHPDLVAAVRSRLQAAGVPYVIENVPQAPLEDPVLLCGSMFGLGAMCRDGVYRQLRRHRLFESNIAIAQPACWHQHPSLGVYGHGSGQGNPIKGYMANAAERAAVMGIDWMTARDIAEAIPPAYTEYIGAFIRSVL